MMTGLAALDSMLTEPVPELKAAPDYESQKKAALSIQVRRIFPSSHASVYSPSLS